MVRLKDAVDRLKKYYIEEEPNFVEGERVRALYGSPIGYIDKGDEGTVIVEFVLEMGGYPVGFYLIGVLLDKNGQKVFGPGMDLRWETI